MKYSWKKAALDYLAGAAMAIMIAVTIVYNYPY